MRASIIIPYFARPRHLQLALKALALQTISQNDFEIIVVDDGSPAAACDFLSKSASIIRTPHRGAAAARNCGIAKAKGNIVIFIDCDIIVEPSFVQNHCNFHELHLSQVALGARQHIAPDGKRAQARDTRLKLLSRYNKKLSELRHPWFMTYTCNVSVPRNMALLEPFDEAINSWGLEDSEWAYRLYKQGCHFTFLESTACAHLYHDRTITDQKFRGWKNNLSYIIKKHPQLSVLNCFIDVFDPQIHADYFAAYDKFENMPCG